MTPSLVLEVAGWAALLHTERVESLGAAGEPGVIPAQFRRRLPAFARDVVRCALPLLADWPRAPVVFASPNGDLDSAVALLRDIARSELISPNLFSLSVHNAPAGILSLCAPEPGDHTAIAAGAASLAAGLVECHLRMACDAAPSVVLAYADLRTPEIYAPWDVDAPGVALAMRLEPAQGGAPDLDIASGRAGVVALARAMADGARRIRFVSNMEAAAA